MKRENDTYKTITTPSEALFKEKGSKFFAFAYHVRSEEDVKFRLAALRKSHHDARHHCYAYYLDADRKRYRANDDGEPNNSAGKPILGQILSKDLTFVLVVVIRYFGGTKLGVGGLISAYKISTAEALSKTEIIEKTVNDIYQVDFNYDKMSEVMRILKEFDLTQVSQNFEINCSLTFSMRKTLVKTVTEKFHLNSNLVIKYLRTE